MVWNKKVIQIEQNKLLIFQFFCNKFYLVQKDFFYSSLYENSNQQLNLFAFLLFLLSNCKMFWMKIVITMETIMQNLHQQLYKNHFIEFYQNMTLNFRFPISSGTSSISFCQILLRDPMSAHSTPHQPHSLLAKYFASLSFASVSCGGFISKHNWSISSAVNHVS